MVIDGLGDAAVNSGLTLTARQRISIKAINHAFKLAVPVDLSLQMHEHRTKADSSAIHQHKLTRGANPANAF